jgi:hypothetical protein
MVYVADKNYHTIRKVTAGGQVTTLAGLAGASGSADGTGSAARFREPRGVAADAAGTVYVADGSHTVRTVTAGGEVTTRAGLAAASGSADGTGSAARFHQPVGVAVDGAGTAYVVDSYNHTIRKVTASGVVTTLAGLAGYAGSADATGNAARFLYPAGITMDGAGNLYVTSSHTIRKVTAAGEVTTLAGLALASGSADGAGSAARFWSPRGVAVDSVGTVYVADFFNHTVRKVTAAGVVTTLAGLAGTSGSEDGTGSEARFHYPAGVAVDAVGTVYVADYGNSTIRKVTAAGVVTTLAGLAGYPGSIDATGSAARFSFPEGVTVDGAGTVYVADTENGTIRKVAAGGAVTTLAGLAGTSGSTDGTGSAAWFDWPTGVAVDGVGTLYVAERFNHAIRRGAPAGPADLSAGLVAYFPFDGNANDVTGNGHGGTAFNGVAYVPGVLGQAASFNGINQYIKARSDGLPTAERSVSLWFHARAVRMPRPVFLGYGGGPVCGTSWFMTLDLTPERAFWLSRHCNYFDVWAPYSPQPVGAWYHLVVTTSPAGTQFFLNGQNIGSSSYFVNNTAVLPGRDLTIGVDVADFGYGPYTDSEVGFFDGLMDEVRIYNRALGLNEILQLFNGATPPPTAVPVTPASGPVAGGTRVTIVGSGFAEGMAVTIGGVAATNVVVVSATTITAVTPPATSAGARDVVVGPTTLPGAFTYLAEVPADVLRGAAGQVPDGSDFLQPALSGDGRYLAYVVTSDAVIAGDTNSMPDVVVRDRVSGAVVRVSVASDGTQANGASGWPRISASGRYVAFWSEASTLVAGDGNGVRDVFLHDRDADGNGVFDETTPGARLTTRVSVASNGAQGNAASALDGDVFVPGLAVDAQLDLSPDGLWVAFRSSASNLVLDDTNGMADVFLYDVAGGRTTRVSIAASGAQADGPSQSPGVSAGAQRVVFASSATNLVAGTADANGVRDVFLVERRTGQVVRLSEPSAGVDANGASDTPSIDDAGRTVVFATVATNLVPALEGSTSSQIIVATLPAMAGAVIAPVMSGASIVGAPVINVADVVKQLASGVLPPSAAAVQAGNGASTQPEVCGNGTCVAYVTAATNLTPGDPDTNGVTDTVTQPIVPTPPPAPPAPVRTSKDAKGNQGAEATTRVAVSANGAVVAMESEAPLTPLAAAANPTGMNVFVRAMPLVVGMVSRTSARVDVSEPVVFTGAGFQTGAVVLFGTMGMTGVVSDEGRTLTVATPTGSTNAAVVPGVVPVSVRNPDGSTVALYQGFTFLAPPASATDGDADADGLPDGWETEVGLNPLSAAGAEGASGDPDADGRTNAQESVAGTHPRGTYTRYLAEGATSAFFTTTLGLANGGTQPVHAWLRFQRSDGTQVTRPELVPAQASRSVTVNTVAGLEAAEFATVVESDGPLAVHRTLTWDPVRGYGSHLEGAVASPATRWYLAEGSTNAGFQLFYLIQNPGTTAAEVEVRFLLPSGAPVVKTYSVSAGSRFNVWVNQIPELASTDCSAVVTSTTGVPIIVERAMYLDSPGLTFGAGHESAGVTAPALDWFLAEGATGAYFDLFLLVANPNDAAAEVEATYLKPDGTTIVKTYTVAPTSRFNIWVDYEDPALADTAVSSTVRVRNGVPVLVERAMWWPQVPGWWEAHNAFGATQTGTVWALGSGEVTGPPTSAATYVLVANTSTWDATVTVSVLFDDGTATVTRTFAVTATSRFNVDVGAEFPEAWGKRFGVVVESVPTTTDAAAQIVVEGARYHNDAAGVVWAAGANALATRLR